MTWSNNACTCASRWNTRSTSSVGGRPRSERSRALSVITNGIHNSGRNIKMLAAMPVEPATPNARSSSEMAHTAVNNTISSDNCLRA